MKQHIESVHEKNEPFQCDVCETSFLQEYSLKQHKESIHEKVKPVTEDLPYSCMKCPKKFGDTKSAQTHFLEDHLDLEEHLNLEDIEMHIEKIEVGLSSYTCFFCKKNYKRRQHLINHIRKKHKHEEKESKGNSEDSNETPKPKEKNYSTVRGRTVTSNLYLLGGFLYRKNRARNNKIYLNCQEYWCENECKGKAELDCLTDTMVKTGNHNHSTKEHDILVNELRHKLLDQAGTLTGKTLHQIYMDLTLDDPVGWAILYKHIEPGMRKRRELLFPRIPKDIYEIDELMQNANLGLNRNYKGILKDKDGEPVGILLYEDDLFDVLSLKKGLGYDGTFFIVPHPFYQLWTIFFWERGQCFPGLSILYLGKKKTMYDAAWQYLNKTFGSDFQPEDASGDFELGAANAAENNCPSLTVKFCYFHYTQCIVKNGQKRGLCNCYINNEEYRHWLKLILCVPLLPDYWIKIAYTELLGAVINFETRAERENFGNLKRYIKKQWNSKKVKPENLSAFEREQATNNGLIHPFIN